MDAQVVGMGTRMRMNRVRRGPEPGYRAELRDYTGAFSAMAERCIGLFDGHRSGKALPVAPALSALDRFHLTGPRLAAAAQSYDGETVISQRLVGVNRRLVFLRANIERLAFIRGPKLLQDTEKLLGELGKEVESIAGGCLTVMPA